MKESSLLLFPILLLLFPPRHRQHTLSPENTHDHHGARSNGGFSPVPTWLSDWLVVLDLLLLFISWLPEQQSFFLVVVLSHWILLSFLSVFSFNRFINDPWHIHLAFIYIYSGDLIQPHDFKDILESFNLYFQQFSTPDSYTKLPASHVLLNFIPWWLRG